jgi:hypothetical protein
MTTSSVIIPRAWTAKKFRAPEFDNEIPEARSSRRCMIPEDKNATKIRKYRTLVSPRGSRKIP